MTSMPFAMIGPYEILAIFIVLALMAALAVGILVWVIRQIADAARPTSRPAEPGPVPTPKPAPPSPSGSVSASATVSLAGSPSAPPGSCPRCGTTLGEGAPAGLCPQCLLAVGLGSEPAAPGREPGANPPRPEDLAGSFPNLEILEPIGQGGMGVVYRAKQRKLDRVVALKVLPRESAKDPTFAERFHREARALARLNHPNIITVYDFGEVDGLFYLVMEYVDGADLRRILQQGRLSPAEALRIVPVICDALQFAHSNGVVHRDIKPGNILLDREGRVKIADFGIAKLAGPPAEGEEVALTQSRQSMGTPHYMAPEQVENPQSVDHRADIYSLGVVFYEMLTGELPLGRFAPPSRRVQLDVRLDEVVLRALEKEPDRRYQQAAEVKTEVERIATGGGGTPGDPASSTLPVEEPAVGWRSWWRLAAAGIAIGLFPVCFLIWRFLEMSGRGSPGPMVFLVALIGAAGAMAPFLVTALGLSALRQDLRRGASRRRLAVAGSVSGLFPALTVLVLLFLYFLTMTKGVLNLRPVETAVLLSLVLALTLGGWLLVWGGRRVWSGVVAMAERRGAVSPALTVALPRTLLVAEFVISAFLLSLFLGNVAPRRGSGMPAMTDVAVRPMGVDPATGSLVMERAWRVGAHGPVLSDWVKSILLAGTEEARLEAIDRALQEAWREYRQELRGHLTVTTNQAGHVVIAGEAIGPALDAIEDRFWTAVDTQLDQDRQSRLRNLLKAELSGSPMMQTVEGAEVPLLGTTATPPSWMNAVSPHLVPFFAFGRDNFTFEYWKVGSWYRWHMTRGMALREGAPGAISRNYQEAADLPALERWLVDLAQGLSPSPPETSVTPAN